MARLNHPNQSPPGGWAFFQSGTRLWIRGEDKGDLINQIVAHRKYKGLDRATPAEAEEDFERQVCEKIDPVNCTAEAGEDYRPVRDVGRNISLSEVKAFTVFAIEHMKNGAALVSVDLAKARAAKCADCHLNQQITNCGACEKVYEMVEKIVPPERRFPELTVCRVCGCGLKVKVNVPIEVIATSEADRNLNYPDASRCWITDELNQLHANKNP